LQDLSIQKKQLEEAIKAGIRPIKLIFREGDARAAGWAERLPRLAFEQVARLAGDLCEHRRPHRRARLCARDHGAELGVAQALAVGAVKLARREVLVQELAAVEGLARVDMLCLDKTGTLTEGRMVLDTVEPVGADALAILQFDRDGGFCLRNALELVTKFEALQ
jgi:hypothetical protein